MMNSYHNNGNVYCLCVKIPWKTRRNISKNGAIWILKTSHPRSIIPYFLKILPFITAYPNTTQGRALRDICGSKLPLDDRKNASIHSTDISIIFGRRTPQPAALVCTCEMHHDIWCLLHLVFCLGYCAPRSWRTSGRADVIVVIGFVACRYVVLILAALRVTKIRETEAPDMLSCDVAVLCFRSVKKEKIWLTFPHTYRKLAPFVIEQQVYHFNSSKI